MLINRCERSHFLKSLKLQSIKDKLYGQMKQKLMIYEIRDIQIFKGKENSQAEYRNNNLAAKDLKTSMIQSTKRKP